MKKVAVLVIGGALAFAAAAATDKVWSNTDKDWDLGNAANWGGTLPNAPDYSAKIETSSTEEQPFVMSATKELTPYDLTLSKTMTLDLGVGSVLLSQHRVLCNSQDTTVTIKSGTVGVQWDAASGERFFIGDNAGHGSSLVADGPNVLLTSAKNNHIQVGTTKDHCLLWVKNGAQVSANMIVGLNVYASNCVARFEGPGSAHTVPADTTVSTVLTVGANGGYDTYELVNQASFTNRSEKPIVIGGIYGSNPARGWNTLSVLDHSSFKTGGDVVVGSQSGTNALEVAGGSSFVCDGKMTIGDSKSGAGNLMSVLDLSAAEVKNGLYIGYGGNGAASADNVLLVSNATLSVKELVQLGYYHKDLARDNRLQVLEDGLLRIEDSTNGRVIVGDSGDDCQLLVRGGTLWATNRIFFVGYSGRGNEVMVDGGVCALTNSFDSTFPFVSVGWDSATNRFIVRNGGRVSVCSTGTRNGQNPPGTLIGYAEGATDSLLVISNGASWVQTTVPGEKSLFSIGYNGANTGCLIDNGSLRVSADAGTGSMITHLGESQSASNCWLHIRNGSNVKFSRLIVSDNGVSQNNEIVVEDSIADFGQFQYPTLKTDVPRIPNLFVVSGATTQVKATSIELGSGMTFCYKIGKDGLRTDGPVVAVSGNGNVKTSTTDVTRPVILKIDTDGFAKAGTYTLLETTNGTITWDDVTLDYDPKRVQIVEQTGKKLVAKVVKRPGLMLLFW